MHLEKHVLDAARARAEAVKRQRAAQQWDPPGPVEPSAETDAASVILPRDWPPKRLAAVNIPPARVRAFERSHQKRIRATQVLLAAKRWDEGERPWRMFLPVMLFKARRWRWRLRWSRFTRRFPQ